MTVASTLKKTYSELNNVLVRAQADYGSVNEWDNSLSLDQWVQKYILPYVKTNANTACASNRSFKCAGVPNAANLGGSSSGYMVAPYVIVTNGGASKAWAFYRYLPAYTEIRVHVYLNIPAKRQAMKGREVFTFVLCPNSSNPKLRIFQPFGLTGTIPFQSGELTRTKLLNGPIRTGGCFKTSGGPDYYGPGDACGAVIMMDDWRIKDDYPW